MAPLAMKPFDAPRIRRHSYDMVGVSPSGSFTVAEHVNASPVCTRVVLLSVTLVTDGLWFSMDTEVDAVSVPPSASVAVAIHLMVSVGLYALVSSVSELPVPTDVPFCVHSKPKVGLPPSGSFAVAEHVSVLVLYTLPSFEVISTVWMVGPYFQR